jgi:polyhydroxyalkanoate synthesis regulator phasin
MPEQFSNTPVPDPSTLTTDQLDKAIANLKQLLETRIGGLEEVIDEKFISVNERFVLVERGRVEQKEDTKSAVDAAFSAAKEAVREQTNSSERSITKSEDATKEQLSQLNTTFTTAINAVTGSLDDLKERVGNIEATRRGATESKDEGRATINSTTAIIGAIVAVFILSFAIYTGLSANNNNPPTSISQTKHYL